MCRDCPANWEAGRWGKKTGSWPYPDQRELSGTANSRSLSGSVSAPVAGGRRQPTDQDRATSPPPPPPPPSQPECDPNYTGCLDPNAIDYDCEGGSGDGPLYTGPVEVIGSDPYDLDRDGDGHGCE